MTLHLDHHGRPLCAAPAAGAFVVDELVHVTCVACLARIAGERARKP